MQQPPFYDPNRPWDRIHTAIRDAVTGDNVVDMSGGRYQYPEWTWLDDPLPGQVEAEVAGTSAAFSWPEADVRRDTRKLYYEELRRWAANYMALYHGRHLTFPVRPEPIESLPPNADLSPTQRGFLHAQGQAVADTRHLAEHEHYNWVGILDYGGWLVADPRHLEGEVPELESRHAAFVSATRKQIPRPGVCPMNGVSGPAVIS